MWERFLFWYHDFFHSGHAKITLTETVGEITYTWISLYECNCGRLERHYPNPKAVDNWLKDMA